MQNTPMSNFTFADEKARRRALGAAFEEVIARAYEREGYLVERRGLARQGGRGDGGIDVLAWLPDHVHEKTAIQCKALRQGEVGQHEVQRMLGIIQSEPGVVRGVLVTTATFTPAARRLAASHAQVDLIDSNVLTRRWGIDGGALHDLYPRHDKAYPEAVTVVHAETSSPSIASPTQPPLPAARRSAVRRKRWPALVACLLAAGLGAGYFMAQKADFVEVKPQASVAAEPKAHAPSPAPTASVPTRVKVPAPRRPSVVVTRPSGQQRHETRSPVDAPIESEPVVIYKSANMTDAEFEAWKQRKTLRDLQPVAEGSAEPVYPDIAPGRSVSRETMQTILRGNHDEKAITR